MDKQNYENFIDKSENNCLFASLEWINIVAEDSWDYLVYEKKGEVFSVLPYKSTRSRFHLNYITPLPLTSHQGPYFGPKLSSSNKFLSKQKEVFNGLLDNLENWDYLRFKISPSFDYFLPFQWRGFEINLACTYRISLTDEKDLWKKLHSKVRNQIKKAQDQVEVLSGLDFTSFFELYEKTFSRQNMRTPLDKNILQRVFDRSREKGFGKDFYSIDASGKVHAVNLIVWDESTAWYLLSAADPVFRSSHAQTLILWEAIKFSLGVSKNFDFEGSSVESIESYFRSFGGDFYTYYSVQACSKRYKRLNTLKNIFR